VSVKAISKPPPSRHCQIFAHSQGVDVTDPATLEIAGRRVMNGMIPAPHIVWRQCQHTDDPPDPVIRIPVAEEGAVAAIVLDHEKPHKESCGRHREEKAEPVTEIKCRPHQGPEQNKWSGRDDDLDCAAPAARLAIAGENPGPNTRIARVITRVSGASWTLGGSRIWYASRILFGFQISPITAPPPIQDDAQVHERHLPRWPPPNERIQAETFVNIVPFR